MLKIDDTQIQSSPEPVHDELLSPQQLLEQWEEAKTAELTANARRLAIEQQLGPFVPAPEEGQKTVKFGPFKVTRTNQINYKGDLSKVREVAAELEITSSFAKESLNETAVKNLRRTDPTAFELMVAAGAVIFSPAKPNYTVARVAVPEPVSSCTHPSTMPA